MNIEGDGVCENNSPPSQILDSAALKSLYRLLLDLSSRDMLCSPYLNGASEIVNTKLNTIIEFKEIRFLSDVLFKVLLERFEELLSFVTNASVTTGLYSVFLENPEELILVLRCCMVILNLLMSDQNLITEKCEVLFSILGRLCHLNLSAEMEQNSWSFKKTVSSDCTYANNHRTTSVEENVFASLCFTSSGDLLPSLVSTIFEVYADELLTHSTLWNYFFLVNSSSATSSENQFLCHTSHSVMGSVIEVVAANFHTSFFHDQSFEDIFNRSFWTREKHFKTPELSLCAGLSLILNPIMFSAPKLLQAHVISLVAETIGTDVISNSDMLDQGIIDCYISAFDSSVILYARNLCSLQVKGHPQCTTRSYVPKSSLHVNSFHQSFESYIQPLTRDKIDSIVTKFECSWDASLSKLYFRKSADLAAASIAYIKENHSVLDDLGKDEMLTMLQIITLIASEDVSNTSSLQTKTIETSSQDLCLITTILKLMSCSLLQVLRYVKHRKSTPVNTSRDASPCTDYVRVLKIVSGCFQQFSTHLPVQIMLCDAMARYPTKHRESKLMLLHFSGILSLCYATGHEFLLKGCIYTMMVSLNLMVSEEGDVEALRSVLDSPELRVYSSRLVPENAQQVLAKRTPSLEVASKFQKVQTVYLSSYSQKKTLTVERTENNQQTETEETSSAKIFLKCILQGGPDEAPSDIDDLAGFIECKEGKDYAQWLKDREKYRKFRHEKKFYFKGKKRKIHFS